MGVTFVHTSAERIARAVRRFEAQYGLDPDDVQGPADEPTWARVTSGTPDGSGHYPATITVYDVDAAVWRDYDAVRLKDANGAALTNNTRYGCRASGATAAGEMLYVTLC